MSRNSRRIKRQKKPKIMLLAPRIDIVAEKSALSTALRVKAGEAFLPAAVSFEILVGVKIEVPRLLKINKINMSPCPYGGMCGGVVS